MPKKKFSPVKKSTAKTVNNKEVVAEKKVKTPSKRRRVRIFVESFRFYRANFWRYTRVAAIVFFTGALLQSYQTRYGSAADLTFLIFMASVMAFMALVWLNINHAEAQKLKVSQIYNSANARFLPFLTVAIIQSVMILPLIFGAFLLIISISLGLTIWMQVLAVVLMLISLLLLLWYSQAAFIVLEQGLTSLRALGQSQKMVKGRIRHLFFDYFTYSVILVLLAAIVGQLTSVVKPLQNNWVVEGVVSGILLTIILSLTSILSYNIYQDVKANYTPPSKAPRKVIKKTA